MTAYPGNPRISCLVALALAAPAAVCGADEFFESRVRPLLVEKCQACHGAQTKMGGLDLSTAEGFSAGVAGRPLINAEDPADSLLLDVVSYEGRVKMPPTGRLSAAESSALRQWIETGGAWPGASSSGVAVRRTKGVTSEDRNHWAFRPVADPTPPAVKDKSWVRNPIDSFVLARLENAGLLPAAPAEKLKLLRRVTYDLTGLPPTPAEIAEFEADSSPEAFDRVVERLLASPRYGERWGRHWLDVARYAESTGMDEDHGYPYAWRYRDYVVQAFNSDLPYDRFVVEQIAGDLLPPAAGEELNRRGIVATGLLALGPKPLAQQDRVQMIYDVVDEQIDVVSKAFLGLTVTCARCHDHKFDPILHTDYYAMAAIFANTKAFRNLGRPGSVSYLHYTPLEPERYEAYQAHRERTWRKRLELEEAVSADLTGRQREFGERLADYLTAAFEATALGGPKADRADLDDEILGRWVALLKTSAAQHWQAWRDATPATVAIVAEEYQAAYLAAHAKRLESLAKWRDRYRTEAELDRNLPARPSVDEAEYPLYAEATLEGGPFDVPDTAPVAALRAELKQLEDSQPEPGPMASAVVDLEEPLEQRVFLRGDHHNQGERVTARFPVVLAGKDRPVIETTSGRLELARWIGSPDNPLTARVMVNRIWQGHFGEGLVRSPNNWGLTGERPTHPELLDWLAARFIESGWSVKAMHRLILGSNAYRMSVSARAGVAEADPENELLSRFNRQRLSVEAMRDGILAVAGDLDVTLGGNLMEEEPGARPNLDPDDTARRTLYIPVRRGSVLTLLSTFDFGDATTPGEGRETTNVAPQALYARNSEFVRTKAARLSELVLAASTAEADRLDDAYLRVLGRRPTAAETDAASTYLAKMRDRLGAADADSAAWASFCHVLLSSNEFLYLE